MTQILEAIVGLEWGDEGKGKIVDARAAYAQAGDPSHKTVVVRFQGGPNAGHSLYVRKKDGGPLQKFVAHAAPSGLASNADIAIGPQVAFDPERFISEVNEARSLFGYEGRILISERTGILLDYHKKLDAWREQGSQSIGTTKSGIGPFYEDNSRRVTRITFEEYLSDKFPRRVDEVLKIKEKELVQAGMEKIEIYKQQLLAVHEPIRKSLAPYTERLEYRLRDYLERGDNIIIEGAQGTMLDVDMGSIPEVTSSHLLAPHAFASLGLPRRAFKVHGVEKVYPTRVGNGILPTLAETDFQEVSQTAGEFGATTGRRRRVGYPDWVLIKRSVMLNDCDGIYITRVDNVQHRRLRVCKEYLLSGSTKNQEVPCDLSTIIAPVYAGELYAWHLWDGPADLSNPLAVDEALRVHRRKYVEGGFESLPRGLQEYIKDHEAFINCPVVGVSIGPGRDETVMRDHE